ncbi:MAG: peroxiredoxin family protein [Planctomycetota bacterium]
MPEKQKQFGLWPAIVISVIILSGVLIWAVVKQQPVETTPTSHDHSHHHDEHSFEPLSEGTDNANHQKMSLRDVIGSARTWGPAYTSWYGKTAPDFTLADITGKQHKLSDYRGKDVMIIFWATWCRPCLMEMPHLIALRNIISEDKLAMLAISNENPALVKNFVENQEMNYVVFSSDTHAMSAPYSQVRSIPSSFFINSEGKIKLATEGMLSLGEMKAIVQAEPQMQ